MAKAKRDGFYKRKGSRFWNTRDPRTGRIRSTGCEGLEAAKRTKGRWELEAADPQRAAVDSETVGTCVDRLIESREARGKQTLFHEQKLGRWLDFLGESRVLATVGPAEFDDFVSSRRADGVTDHTIVKEVGCMLRAMKLSKRLGVYRGELSVLRPLDLVSSYEPRTRALSAAELSALLAELSPSRGAFVAIIVALGLRRGEALALRPEHVNLAIGVVDVPGTKTKLAKRTVPILAPFRGLVEACLPHLPLDDWGRSNYLRDLKAACRRVGIEPVTANDLRRTFVTLLENAKVDRDAARRLVGHSPKSQLLELVYDQPKPHELAARAGDLSTLTLQLGGVEIRKTLRAREDSNLGPTAPEACSQIHDLKGFRELPATRSAGLGWTESADATGTLQQHSPAAHALAMAFVNVTRRGAA